MVKLILVGLWACLMTLASTYAATTWKANLQKVAAADPSSQNYEYKKTKEFTVPKINDGQVQGYVVVELSYMVDKAVQKSISVPAEAFLLDEAYRYIYDDESLNFKDLKKYDLSKLKKSLADNVDARLNATLIKDVMIEEFSYLSHLDTKRQL